MNAEPVLMRRRIARTISIAVIAVLATSACAAGRDAQTANQSASLDGTNKSVGDIDLRALSIQAPPTGSTSYPVDGAARLTMVLINNSRTGDTLTSITSPAATGWAAFDDNAEAFRVQEAANASSSAAPSPAESSSSPSGTPAASGQQSGGSTASTSESASATSSAAASSEAPLPTGSTKIVVRSGVRTSYGTPEAPGAVLLTGLTKAIYAGTTIPITFTFDRAGPITISVPIQVTSVPNIKVGDSEPSPTGEEIP